jgi:hypothetical protein
MNEVSKPCLKCGKLGIEKSAEILPDQGMLIQVIHTLTVVNRVNLRSTLH